MDYQRPVAHLGLAYWTVQVRKPQKPPVFCTSNLTAQNHKCMPLASFCLNRIEDPIFKKASAIRNSPKVTGSSSTFLAFVWFDFPVFLLLKLPTTQHPPKPPRPTMRLLDVMLIQHIQLFKIETGSSLWDGGTVGCLKFCTADPDEGWNPHDLRRVLFKNPTGGPVPDFWTINSRSWMIESQMSSDQNLWHSIILVSGTVGCTPTNVPLWEIPNKPYISLYSGCLWVIIPKNPSISPINTMGTLLGVHPIVPWWLVNRDPYNIMAYCSPFTTG